MQIKEIDVSNFKSLQKFSLDFPDSNIIGENGDREIKITVIIGENGTSKTTILQSIIESFSFRSNKTNVIHKNNPLVRIKYELDGKMNTLTNIEELSNTKAYPESIIVSSYAMIDKLTDYSIPENSRIKIVGTSSKLRSLSNKSKIKNTSNQILKDYMSINLDNLFSILNYIGFATDDLEVAFEISSYSLNIDSNKADRILQNEEALNFMKVNYPTFFEYSIDEVINKSIVKLNELSLNINYKIKDHTSKIYKVINNLLNRGHYSEEIVKCVIHYWYILEKFKIMIKKNKINNKNLLFISSFKNNYYYNNQKEMQLDLKFLEILSVSLVNDTWLVSLNRGQQIALSSLSSGELSMFLRLYDLQSNIKTNSIVLIDEPETHLHPKWINGYVKTLLEMFGDIKCHIIIATHSPLIISDVSKNSIIGLKKKGDLISQVTIEDKTLGLNYDDVLSDVFNLQEDGAMIYEYKDLIVNALKEKKLDLALKIYSQMADSETKFEMFKEIKKYKETEM